MILFWQLIQMKKLINILMQVMIVIGDNLSVRRLSAWTWKQGAGSGQADDGVVE